MVKNTNISAFADGEAASEKQKSFLLKVRKCFWVAIATIALLLILSIVVLSIRIAEYAQADSRAVGLKTNMTGEIDVFSINYKNSSGEIVVKGANGDKVIAPGTDVSYTIRLRNVDKYALDYRLEPGLTFNSLQKLPILVRIIDPDDNYILGSATEWAPLEEIGDVYYTGILKKNETVEYVFQWMWPFESGNDAFDTSLGDVSDNIELNVSFELSAVANTNVDVNGGLVPSGMARNLALLIAAILLFIIMILLIASIVKRHGKEPEPVLSPPPAPVPKTEYVIVSRTPPKRADFGGKVSGTPLKREDFGGKVSRTLPKREGFGGKNIYINFDITDDKR